MPDLSQRAGRPAGAAGAACAVQMTVLTLLRVAIGWHFLYEGLAKLYEPNWSSAAYLDLSRWVLAPWFQQLAADPVALRIVDLANIWGLMAIGLGLMLGLLTRLAAFFGIVLVGLYYAAHPAWPGLGFGAPAEGHYLIINKNLVELAGLIVILIFPTGRFLGLDRIVHWLLKGRRQARLAAAVAESGAPSPLPLAQQQQPAAGWQPPLAVKARREVLAGLATVPFVGAFAAAVWKNWSWRSFEVEALKKRQADAVTGATVKAFSFATLKDLKGQVPRARLGGLELSRMLLGGNLMGGWAHARDLIYVDKLVKAYHHRDKIFETFLLAEKCGINAVITNPVLCDVIADYKRRNIGKIEFISDSGGRSLEEGVKRSIDGGAAACYLHGGVADDMARGGPKKLEEMGRLLEIIRRSGLPAGIGCHAQATLKACAEFGLKPDFWMKTLHPGGYWSAKPAEEHDNIWCKEPDETIAFMKDRPEPWIAFKTLAAGAVHPNQSFRYAFENGADFICVGMYDFQIVEDVNIVLDALNGKLNRRRPWRAT